MVINDPRAQQPSQMFLTWVKAKPQHRELCAPTFYEYCVGSLSSHSYLQQLRVMRRDGSLTICWCNYKGSTFYSVTLRPWVLVRLELNSQPLAWQLDANQLSHQCAVKPEHLYTALCLSACAVYVITTYFLISHMNVYLINHAILHSTFDLIISASSGRPRYLQCRLESI